MQICSSKTICILRIVKLPHKADVLKLAHFLKKTKPEKSLEFQFGRLMEIVRVLSSAYFARGQVQDFEY